MKKILFVMMLFIFLAGSSQIHVNATEQQVTAEKLWTVSLNAAALSTEENFKKIKVTNSKGEEVAVNVTVNETDSRLLEVTTKSVYELNEVYTLTIPAGFESKQGLTLTEDTYFNFSIDKQMTTESLNGNWATSYTYRDTAWAITASFSSGIVNLQLKSGPTTHNGVENYDINDGLMSMNVEALSMNLNGQIQVYNDNYFKIVTKSGKVAYFHKVQ